MGEEMAHIGRPGWRLYDTRCFGYLAHAEPDGRVLVAPFDRTTTWPTADAARAVAERLEPGRWMPVDEPQAAVVARSSSTKTH
ncbi:MAG: hypothetical protein JWN46_92 [Acidimicrobiales bacterium]|nr:hypothetical protein [Acidimicrobiales bacterium]